MNILGIYIYNSTRDQWYSGKGTGDALWCDFSDAVEFPEGTSVEAMEKLREEISGDDVTFTMAALH